jgi:hypothetical protein
MAMSRRKQWCQSRLPRHDDPAADHRAAGEDDQSATPTRNTRLTSDRYDGYLWKDGASVT